MNKSNNKSLKPSSTAPKHSAFLEKYLAKLPSELMIDIWNIGFDKIEKTVFLSRVPDFQSYAPVILGPKQKVSVIFTEEGCDVPEKLKNRFNDSNVFIVEVPSDILDLYDEDNLIDPSTGYIAELVDDINAQISEKLPFIEEALQIIPNRKLSLEFVFNYNDSNSDLECLLYPEIFEYFSKLPHSLNIYKKESRSGLLRNGKDAETCYLALKAFMIRYPKVNQTGETFNTDLHSVLETPTYKGSNFNGKTGYLRSGAFFLDIGEERRNEIMDAESALIGINIIIPVHCHRSWMYDRPDICIGDNQEEGNVKGLFPLERSLWNSFCHEIRNTYNNLLTLACQGKLTQDILLVHRDTYDIPPFEHETRIGANNTLITPSLENIINTEAVTRLFNTSSEYQEKRSYNHLEYKNRIQSYMDKSYIRLIEAYRRLWISMVESQETTIGDKRDDNILRKFAGFAPKYHCITILGKPEDEVFNDHGGKPRKCTENPGALTERYIFPYFRRLQLHWVFLGQREVN
ncbi:hypothetical protein WICPIJ_007922 [Wickerhamomyces pijperi]|uniref:Uncharacterized protein n=1 Tax=Wickerhamomyces pijperi TaxID=599730 RepID=A0A9P8Q0S0_WICPI|nr:hypothetical protein WICPIJ_007922 [Wickerhamomyces pijperi]